MEENKYLKLARQARSEDNTEDAKAFYDKVRTEDPTNGEAKYFYMYYALYDGKNKEIPNRFGNLCKGLKSAIELIIESALSKDEKLKGIEEIVDSFVPEVWSINKYMNGKNTSQIKVFDFYEIKSCAVAGMSALKALGDQIDKAYIGDMEAKRLAVIAWKEYVSLSQKWYSWAIKGDAEIYAEKIKKFDSSYEMPKKAGCISCANKK